MQPTDKSRFKSPTEMLEADTDSDWMKRGLEISRNEVALESVWRQAAGELASHSQLNHIDQDHHAEKGSVAIVFADSPSWASHIRVCATRLCRKINAQLASSGSDQKVSSIRVRVTPHQPNFEDRT